MALHIIDEANRCLNCKKPMCQQGCPVHTPIPHIIQMFKENRLMEAGEELFQNNPMSVICSIVCNHEQQCEGHCVLGRKGNPVHFSSIENYISDMYLDRMKQEPVKKKEQKTAVIGAGPAGMTVAIMLAQQGYGVTIFEWKDKIGGIMQYGIPDFRLPKSILDRYQIRFQELDVKVRPNTTIGAVLKIEELLRDGYASVFIGTGNAAMDVTRTALRNGARQVTMYARGTRVAASSHEVAYTKLDGAEFAFGYAIQSINEKGPVFKKSILDEEGKVIGTEDELIQVEADSTIISISQGPRRKLIRTTLGLEGGDNGLLIVDENYMTTKEGVFAASDVISGSKTVVHAVDGAKKAAEAMIKYMEETK